MQPHDVPPERLAELYGMVVTPEEARRFYRRQAWLRVGVLWGITLFFLGVLLAVALSGGV